MLSCAVAPRATSVHPPMSRSKWSRRPQKNPRSQYAWVWTVPGVDPTLCPADPIKRRIVEELMAAVLTLERGKRIHLKDCDCLTDRGRPLKDRPFPCEHVMEAAADPALKLILKSERLTKGVSGTHTLDRTARMLALQKPGKPGCWGYEGVKDGYHPSRLPFKPTTAEPNTKEKDNVFWDRFLRGESLFHPNDPRYEVPLPEDGEGVDHDD